MIEWFKGIPDKESQKFIIFDIKDFYPLIGKKLMTKAIEFAKLHTHIANEDMQIIQHSRKSLLFHDNQAWMKNNANLFDVTMGAYDGAEVCELVCIYIQHQLSQHNDTNNIGLY